jgi:hypothetical protein
LEFLAGLLDQAARYAQTKIDAIPENAGIEYEAAEIESVIAPAAAIAERMIALPVKGGLDHMAKARAQAWLDGKYSHDLPQAA